MDDLIKKMKEDYDSLHPVDRGDYVKLWGFLEFKEVQKKEIIRRGGLAEDRVVGWVFFDQGTSH